MITERDVEWTCRACIDFENCLLKHILDDKTCRSFHPDQQYIDCELRRLNGIEREKNQREKAKELGAKDCPFCGGYAVILAADDDWEPGYIVSCHDTECRGHSYPHGLSPKTPEEAVAKWNRMAKE